MPRSALPRTLIAALLVALAPPVPAAEATRVLSSFDDDNPFDLDFAIGFDYLQNRALIKREYAYDYPTPTTAVPLAKVEERPELRYLRRSAAIRPRLAIGLYHDLEVHFEIPVVLQQNTSWHYARHLGKSQDDATSATGRNGVDANGDPCAGPCAALAPAGQVFHGSGFGDVKIGLSWGILSDLRDDTKPFWMVGVDFTLPTAKRYDPAVDRSPTTFTSPYSTAARSGPFGENAYQIDFVTALSKRMGSSADPYVRFHWLVVKPSANTYSNCEHAAALNAMGQMSDVAPTACAAATNTGAWGADPPYTVGASFGTEVVTYENKADDIRVGLDFRLSADYVSSGRWYDELTDATGKLLHSQDHFNVDAYFGFYWRASKYMQFQATARLGTQTAHWITGEPTGSYVGGKASNPNYDYRYDAAGSRYRLTEASDFGLALTGLLQF
jgi:hypothetical protein